MYTDLAAAWIQQRFYELGQAHGYMVKVAGTPATSLSLVGRLVISASGWGLLTVPNAVVRGLFDSLDESGIELPLQSDGTLNAHISVLRPEEIEKIGGAGKISEKGHPFHYNIGPMQTVVPGGWEGMSRVWFVKVHSPELQELRRSYGLTPLPNDNKYDFHITVARRRKNVLRENEVSKAAALRPLDPVIGRLFEMTERPEAATPGAPKRVADNTLPAIDRLLEAKRLSDRGHFRAKHDIVRAMLQEQPDAWRVDSQFRDVVGLTHQPTGFRLHMPQRQLPAGFPR